MKPVKLPRGRFARGIEPVAPAVPFWRGETADALREHGSGEFIVAKAALIELVERAEFKPSGMPNVRLEDNE